MGDVNNSVFRGSVCSGKGPYMLQRGILSPADQGYEPIHYDLKALKTVAVGPFKADLIPPGRDTASYGPFDYLEVPVIRTADPGQNIPVIQYYGKTIVQKHS
jgi:hypothetical protein